MKDKACCYDCLHHISKRGISSCKLTGKEIVSPFESICSSFVCFQCTKNGRGKCECYKEVK